MYKLCHHMGSKTILAIDEDQIWIPSLTQQKARLWHLGENRIMKRENVASNQTGGETRSSYS